MLSYVIWRQPTLYSHKPRVPASLSVESMRIAIIYDCLYPNTIGGGEHWYRKLADGLASKHRVTYLTRHQWKRSEGPDTAFKTVAVSPGGPLYKKSGRRRMFGPVLFGIGIFFYMLRHGRRFEVIDCAANPFFSLIAVKVALSINRSKAAVVTDWFECWTNDYWKSYLGSIGGSIGYWLQSTSLRLSDKAITFSQLVSERLRAEGYSSEIVCLRGLYSGPTENVSVQSPSDPPFVLFAGRHIPEKRVASIPAAIDEARREIPNLVCKIFGEGPERQQVIKEIQKRSLEDVIQCPGFVDRNEIDEAMEQALCLVLPSEREGYGIVVVESAGRGTPAVVAASANSAASELIEDGENGFIAASAEPGDLAEAISRVYEGGIRLRERTANWFSENSDWLSVDRSVESAEDTFSRAKRNTSVVP